MWHFLRLTLTRTLTWTLDRTWSLTINLIRLKAVSDDLMWAVAIACCICLGAWCGGRNTFSMFEKSQTQAVILILEGVTIWIVLFNPTLDGLKELLLWMGVKGKPYENTCNIMNSFLHIWNEFIPYWNAVERLFWELRAQTCGRKSEYLNTVWSKNNFS